MNSSSTSATQQTTGINARNISVPKAIGAEPAKGQGTTCEGAKASAGTVISFPVSLSPTILVTDGSEAGEAGKGGGTGIASLTGLTPTNAEFCRAIFTDLPAVATPIVTAKPDDPQKGVWIARPVAEIESVCRSDWNTYFNCSSFRRNAQGYLAAQKELAEAYHVLVLDDVGSKVDRALLGSIQPTWELETSPGNFQIGFKINPPLRDAQAVDEFQQRIAAAGLTDRGAKGMARWMRLPNGINGKGKYRVEGKPFRCRLHVWNPKVSFAADKLADTLAPVQIVAKPKKVVKPSKAENEGANWEVYQPRRNENPVLTAFKAKGLYKREVAPGKHEVTCPWVHEHTDEIDSGSTYFEPNETYNFGGFSCLHSHKDDYHIRQVAEHFGLSLSQARNRPVIRIVSGELHSVVAAAEGVLAEQEDIFHAGGLIVKAALDARTGDWGLRPVTEAELTMILSKEADWEKYDKRSSSWERSDPSARHVMTLHRGDTFERLLPVIGLARQPYYRENGGELVTTPGYDRVSQRLGVFDGAKFPQVGNTKAEAVEALALLDGLLAEFHFTSAADRAAALSALLTSAVRPGLDLAPAFHVTAPASGSGKSYLCEVISSFAGPGVPARMSYPKTSDEATKAIMAVLLGAPAVIEFDDMDADWLPHGSINRMLTSKSITDRILGQSKTATASTNALILGSGNNVGPIRDLRRRVLTITLNTRSAMPGTIAYTGNPVAALGADRERYITAAFTIIEAWKAAGSLKENVSPIATYNGAWANYCRHPLIWLGLPDPATNLIEQMSSDPDDDQLKAVLQEWHRKFGEEAITIRRLLGDHYAELEEAISELPVTDQGRINRTKLGWYLKRKMNRIVGGFMLNQAPTGERMAWKVVKVEGGEPASPPLAPPVESAAAEDEF